MNSGGFLDSHLSERTSILGLRVWVLIGIGVGLSIALILACLLLIWLCSAGRAGRVSEKLAMIPVVSKEISIDRVSKNAAKGGGRGDDSDMTKKWAAMASANGTEQKKDRTVRFKLADALSPKFMEDLERGHRVVVSHTSLSRSPTKVAADMANINIRIPRPRQEDASALHTAASSEGTEKGGVAEKSAAGGETGTECLHSQSHGEAESSTVMDVAKEGGAGEEEDAEMTKAGNEKEAGKGCDNEEKEAAGGKVMDMAEGEGGSKERGDGDGGVTEASSSRTIVGMDAAVEKGTMVSFCAACSDREMAYCASSSSSSPANQLAGGGWGQWYTLRDLQLATDFFSDANLLGEGGYGVVYRGHLPDGTFVAVKNLLNNRGQAEKEFRVEVEAIGRVRHKNLIRLIGYCAEGTHRLLVYEYVDNGNLDQWLHGKAGEEGKLSIIPWAARMKIALGTAKGLAYLHEGLEPKVVHRDIKSSNILLDTQWNAKVSDFGLAKLLGDGTSFVTTRVMGTFGYVAPEYANSGLLNERSDVYSFGVLLMEIITGRDPVDYGRPSGEVNLVDWLKMMVASRRAEDVVDPKLSERPSSRALKRALLVALRCVDPDAQKRPKMGHVVHMLEADDYPYRDDRRGSARMKNSPHHNHQVAMLARDAFNKDNLGWQARASPIISPGRSYMGTMTDDMFELVLESPSGPGYKPSLRKKALVQP